MKQIAVLLIALVTLGLIIGCIERLWPAVRQKVFREQWRVDVCYWFFNPIFTKTVTTICVGVVIFSVVALTGIDADVLRTQGFGPVAAQPLWLIVFEMLVFGDFLGYWIHRMFHHVDDLWDIHCVHHSSEKLDWLSAVRVHPLNDIFSKTLRVLPFAMMGFPLTALAFYLPVLILLAIFLHANVPWSFGPLRYIIASPNFHRWHHTSAAEGQSKNFAGLFPIFDWLFGTLYLPQKPPVEFGISEVMPATFFRQLAYPFKPQRLGNAVTEVDTRSDQATGNA